MIPRVCHFYWGGGRLSALQYLSIVSFKRYNPDYVVNLWMPASTDLVKPTWGTMELQDPYTKRDYLPKAKAICEVKTIDMEVFGFGNSVHEAQRADFFKWYILSTEGGIWSDIDILYVQSIDPLIIDTDVALTYFDYPTAGFLASIPNGAVFKTLAEGAQDLFKRNMLSGYQSLGPDLVSNKFPSFETMKATYPAIRFRNLPMEIFYPFKPNTEDMRRMFFRAACRLPKETVGIHWYNGHPLAKKYQNGFKKFRKNTSVISKRVKQYEI